MCKPCPKISSAMLLLESKPWMQVRDEHTTFSPAAIREDLLQFLDDRLCLDGNATLSKETSQRTNIFF